MYDEKIQLITSNEYHIYKVLIKRKNADGTTEQLVKLQWLLYKWNSFNETDIYKLFDALEFEDTLQSDVKSIFSINPINFTNY